MFVCVWVHSFVEVAVVLLIILPVKHHSNTILTGKEVASFRGHDMPVLDMAYHWTGTLLATASADRTVRVTDARHANTNKLSHALTHTDTYTHTHTRKRPQTQSH
jgi:WD40 repeat protein